MNKYKVYGTIELNFEIEVEADSEIEAMSEAKEYAEDGHGLGEPTGQIDVNSITKVE